MTFSSSSHPVPAVAGLRHGLAVHCHPGAVHGGTRSRRNGSAPETTLTDSRTTVYVLRPLGNGRRRGRHIQWTTYYSVKL